MLCNLLWFVLVFKFCLPNWIARETEAEILSPSFVSSSGFRSWLWMRWAFSKRQRNGQLRFSSLLCLLRKGNSELDSEFQPIWLVGHRQVSSLKASLCTKPRQGSRLTWAEKSYAGFLIRVTLLFHVSDSHTATAAFTIQHKDIPLVSFCIKLGYLCIYLFVCLFMPFASCLLTRLNIEIKIVSLHPMSLSFSFGSRIDFMKSEQIYLVIPILFSNLFLISQSGSKKTGKDCFPSHILARVSCRQWFGSSLKSLSLISHEFHYFIWNGGKIP